MSELELIRRATKHDQIIWKKHALEKMLERNISRHQVRHAIEHGMIIEKYPTDYPIPSMLIAGLEPEPLHIVLAFEPTSQMCHIITVYRPDTIHFQKDGITRRST